MYIQEPSLLFSKQPFIETLVENRFDYILVAQNGDHKELYNYVISSDDVKTFQHRPKLDFFFPQILELVDDLFQRCRAKVGARKKFWNMVSSLVNILLFDSWTALLQFILDPDSFAQPRIVARRA